MYKVSSEIYKETDYQPVKSNDGTVVSRFKFVYPKEANNDKDVTVQTDKDGDLVVQRRSDIEKKTSEIQIAHSEATELRLVGLQVWRGALLLADFIFHRRHDFYNQQLLELGAGTGLTSIASAIILPDARIACTDVDIGGILNLIRGNVRRNKHLYHCDANDERIKVFEYDFLRPPSEYNAELMRAIDDCDIVLAADVIYDDCLTDAFIKVIDHIFSRQRSDAGQRKKIIYVALEKRFVFTMCEMDAVAPMFEYFLKQTERKPWQWKYIDLDFPQYFEYERCKQLVLLELTSRN